MTRQELSDQFPHQIDLSRWSEMSVHTALAWCHENVSVEHFAQEFDFPEYPDAQALWGTICEDSWEILVCFKNLADATLFKLRWSDDTYMVP